MWILIAFVAAIGLTALAIYAVFEEFGSASKANSAQSVVTGVSTIISNALTDYAGNPDFSGISKAAQSEGIFPSSWAFGTNGYSMPGGGLASIASAPVNGGTSNGFTLTLSNLSGAACAQLGTFYTPNVSSISVNGTAADNPDYNNGTATDWPPSLSGDCTSTSNGGKLNTVEITVAGQ